MGSVKSPSLASSDVHNSTKATKRRRSADDAPGIAKNIQASSGLTTAVLDIDTLRKSVTCLLCDNVFLDAVVARCSHAFCRACIEKHLRSAVSSCPICNSPPLRVFKAMAKKRPLIKRSPPLFYHRSEHLDGIVWLLLEAQSADAVREFKMREEEHHRYLRDVGIDPFSNPGLWEEQQTRGASEKEKCLDGGNGKIRKMQSVASDEEGDYRYVN